MKDDYYYIDQKIPSASSTLLRIVSLWLKLTPAEPEHTCEVGLTTRGRDLHVAASRGNVSHNKLCELPAKAHHAIPAFLPHPICHCPSKP